MPGLSQLKQFNSDILNLGDEVKIRSARGEKALTVPIPKGIDFEDDSEDFRLGMPELSEEEEQQAEALAAERDRDAMDYSDITGEEKAEEALASIDSAIQAAPDVSDLLAPAVSADLDDLDLSAFEEPKEEAVEETPKETPIEDMDLDSLLTLSDPSLMENSDDSEQEEENEIDAPPAPAYRTGRLNPHKMEHEPSMSDLDYDTLMAQAVSTEAPTSQSEAESTVAAPEDPFAGTDFAQDNFDLGNIGGTTASADTGSSGDGFDIDTANSDFSTPSGNFVDMNEGIPEEFNEKPSAEETSEMPSFGDDLPDFNMDGGDDLPPMQDSQTADESPLPPDPFASDDLPDFGGDTEAEGGSAGNSWDEGGVTLNGSETPDFKEEDEEPLETFDTTGMDIDFSEPGAVRDSTDDPFGVTSTEDDFEIPNFTDNGSGKKENIAPAPNVSSPNFDEAIEGDEKNKPKNTFTDAEYKRFRKNLSEYPLNLRLAIEEIVVKNEFTDDKVFEILDKVQRKVPARQLASQLDKEMEIHVDVPRDYERRTAEEYENYKQSLEYKIKNQIIPFAAMTAFAAILITCIGFLFWTFIWNPMMANRYYKEGYADIQTNQYQQSEECFSRAVRRRPVKKWFYKYAESYREHKQYDRASNVYKAGLEIFDHDKKSGLDWADMEMNERYNYEEAERILLREVRDYHRQDPEVDMKLGDLYLAWADDGYPEKYAAAKEQYDLLVSDNQKSKHIKTYLARQMRYYIHVDDLKKVLEYKNYFYPTYIKALDYQDLTELSGYLLDKRYGTLRPSEESLRSQVVDIRDLLDRALKANSSNPDALYNMGRYLVRTGASSEAESVFKATIDAFKKKSPRKRKDNYTYIDTYRLLGEEQVERRAYIDAQRTYNEGIAIFEHENASGGFTGTEKIGKLYEDLGNINYFINGDMDAALENYEKSVENSNDSLAVRYKIGYIQYTDENYDDAWMSFNTGNELTSGQDIHTLLALANTLVLRGLYGPAQGYYEDLLDILKEDVSHNDIMMPQSRADHGDLVDTYMKASNNLGVALSRISGQSGDSDANGKAIVQFAESSRAWDALSRNQETMIRRDTNDLGKQNSTYVVNPAYGYEPTIYSDIPKTIYEEKALGK